MDVDDVGILNEEVEVKKWWSRCLKNWGRSDLRGLSCTCRRFEFVCALTCTFFGCGSRHSNG